MRSLLVAIAVAIASTPGCAAEEREAPRTANRAPASPMVALERAEFGEQEGGKPVWKAAAARAAFRPDSRIVDLVDVEARFYEEGRPVTRGTAPTAVWRQAEHDLRLGGGVELEAIGARAGVGARDARWDPSVGRLLASGGVRFWQGANRLTARELRADRTLRRVELRGGVHGVFALGEGTPLLFDRSTDSRRTP